MPANVQSMFYVKEEGTPWHGSGIGLEGFQTAESAIKASGLDWSAKKVALKDADGNDVPNYFSIRREDNKKSLGVVGNNYTILQNKDSFSFMDSIIQEKGANFSTAGSLGQGERVWMLAKIDGIMEARKNDSLLKYLLLSNTHDGSGKVTIATTCIRTVCENTLILAIKEAGSIFKIKHTKNMGSKVSDAREALGIVNTYYKNFEENLKKMTATKMNVQGFKDYLGKVGFDSEADKGRAKGQIDELVNLFGEGKGNKGESIWDAYNSITEWTDWNRSTRVTKSGGFQTESEARLNSQWFGSGAIIKQKALEVAVGLAA